MSDMLRRAARAGAFAGAAAIAVASPTAVASTPSQIDPSRPSAVIAREPAAKRAAAPPPTARRVALWIAWLDADADGAVSRAEALAHRGGLLPRLDANQNGVLDNADLSSAAAAAFGVRRLAAILEALDLDGDGSVSLKELVTGPVPAFDAADLDGDGVVGRAEALAYFGR